MRHMLLLTMTNGNSLLVGDNGLTIEPEPHTGRSIVILPNGNREKPKIIVQQNFVDICSSLSRAGHLIEITPEPHPEPEIVKEVSWGPDVGKEVIAETDIDIPVTPKAAFEAFSDEKVLLSDTHAAAITKPKGKNRRRPG